MRNVLDMTDPDTFFSAGWTQEHTIILLWFLPVIAYLLWKDSQWRRRPPSGGSPC